MFVLLFGLTCILTKKRYEHLMTYFGLSLFSIRRQTEYIFFVPSIWQVKNMSTAKESNAKSRLGFKCTSVSCAEDEFPSMNFSIKLFCALPLSTTAATPKCIFQQWTNRCSNHFLNVFQSWFLMKFNSRLIIVRMESSMN